MRFRPVLVLLLVLPVLAACGGSGAGSSGQGLDPASAVPAEAPLYFEIVARPDGDLKKGAEDAMRKLLRTEEPGRRAVELFDKLAAGGGVSWKELEGWLGGRVGFFLSGFKGNQPTGAVVAQTTDAAKARATLDKLARNDKDVETAVLGDWAVLGTRDGVEAVRRATAEGGRTLDGEADFRAAREEVGADGALGHLYVKPQAVLDAVASLGASAAGSPFGDQQTLGVLRQMLAKAGRASAVSFGADGTSLRMRAASIGAPDGGDGATAAENLAGLPGDAWLGIGFGDLGKAASDAIAQFEQLAGTAGGSSGSVVRAFERRLGVNLREDFLSWMGAGAVYARGRSIADIGGVVTVETKDPERSRRAVGVLARALQGAGATVQETRVPGYDVAVELRNAQVPASLIIAANQERFSVGVNPQAVAEVNEPGDTLADSDAFGRATETLGDGVKPVALIDTQTIIGLLETFGIGTQQGYARAKPYLDALGPLSAGTGREGDVSRLRLALGLR